MKHPYCNISQDDEEVLETPRPFLSSSEEEDVNRDVPFEVGEIVKFKGGEFKIHSIGKKFIVFKALAGTSWVKR